MKTKFLPLLALLSLLAFSSCEELAITFEDVVIEETLDISGLIPKTASIVNEDLSYTFEKSSTFGMSDADNGSNSTESLSDYLESLSNVTVKSMEFMILELASDENLLVNSLFISVSNSSGEIYSEQFENITPLLITSAENLSTEAITAISTSLLNQEELNVTASGEVTGNVQSFDLLIKIVSDVEADALDALESFL